MHFGLPSDFHGKLFLMLQRQNLNLRMFRQSMAFKLSYIKGCLGSTAAHPYSLISLPSSLNSKRFGYKPLAFPSRMTPNI